MKYLTKYGSFKKKFESIEVSPSLSGEMFSPEFVNNLEDRCLEISDMGYVIDIYPVIYKKLISKTIGDDKIGAIENYITCCVAISGKDNAVNLDDIKDTKEIITDYVSGLGYNVDIETVGGVPLSMIKVNNATYYNRVNILIYKPK